MQIKVPAYIALIGLVAATFLAGQQPNGKALLEQARSKRAAGDLQSATDTLETVIANSASDRNAAANALLEMAGIAESLGQAGRARTFYERVRTEFKDQSAETAIATARLAGGTTNTPAKVTIRTPFADDLYSFAISPDGRTVVFQGVSPDGKRHLWRQAVDAAQKPEPIAGTEDAGQNAFPFFSPDGRTIAFFMKQKLWQVDLTGGVAKELAAAPSPAGGAWSGNSILMAARGVGGPIEVIENGRVRSVTTEAGLFVTPRFLDDRRFLYFARNQQGTGTIQVGSLDGSANSAKGLPAAHAASYTRGFLLFVTTAGSLSAMPFDPKELAATGAPAVVTSSVGREARYPGTAAFAVSASGAIAYRESATQKRQMVWMDRTGALLATLDIPDSASPANPRLSPNGQSILYFRQLGAALGSIWEMDSSAGNPTLFRDFALGALWSPGGEEVITSSMGNTGGVLSTQPASGGGAGVPAGISVGAARGAAGRGGAGQRPVLSPGGFSAAFPDDWGRNGYILYHTGNGTGTGLGGDLYALPPNQGNPIPVAASPGTDRNARFSPDSNWIAYQTDESGRNEVYVQAFPGSMEQRQRVSLSGGVNPQWSRDGRELYFLSYDNHLMAVTAEAVINGDKRSIEFGTPKPLFVSPLPPGSEFDVDRATGRFLFLTLVEDPPPIIVISNPMPAR